MDNFPQPTTYSLSMPSNLLCTLQIRSKRFYSPYHIRLGSTWNHSSTTRTSGCSGPARLRQQASAWLCIHSLTRLATCFLNSARRGAARGFFLDDDALLSAPPLPLPTPPLFPSLPLPLPAPAAGFALSTASLASTMWAWAEGFWGDDARIVHADPRRHDYVHTCAKFAGTTVGCL